MHPFWIHNLRDYPKFIYKDKTMNQNQTTSVSREIEHEHHVRNLQTGGCVRYLEDLNT